jgi:hypothetical protein
MGAYQGLRSFLADQVTEWQFRTWRHLLPTRQSALAPGRLADLAEDAAPCRGLIAAGGRRGECGWPERRRGEDRDSDRLGGVGLKVKKS